MTDSPSSEAQECVVRLVRAVLSVRPLVDALAPPVHVASMVDGDAPLECLLNRIARRTGSPEFKVLDAAAPSKLTIFEQIVSERLRAGGPYEAPLHLAPSDASQFDPAIDAAIQEDFDRRFNRTEIRSFDGARIRAYTAGDPRNEAVMIIPACGMPAKLCESWINFLAKTNFVLTTETRGLFDLSSTFDSLAWDVSAQAKDVLAVMDHFGVKAGHLMGLCGGAVVAAAAAIHGPQRVSSMSLWYGDFDLGPSSPKTIYQQNLKEVMLLAGAGRSEAESTHDLFCGAMVKTARADLAHLVLYPFATPELLYRYAKVNGSIMCTNIAPLLANPFPRTLVVTSQDDSTAHPAASREVAARLPKSVLHVEPHGDHLSFYDANPQLTELASRFIAGNST